MQTERLFDFDSYQKTFRARVIAERTLENRRWVILDRTGFYPESGGQPSDRGSLNGIAVGEVREDGEAILHQVDGPVSVGDEVQGEIDWDRRFGHMQQHSGQHILSQAFLQDSGASTLGFHLGSVVSTLDLSRPDLSSDILDTVEKLANRIVSENRTVTIHRVSREELHRFTVRREVQAEGPIRLVEIEGFECTGCCGTHVRRTGDIGAIKVIRNERYKGGSRITFVCGFRALADYQMKHHILEEVCRHFSVSEKDLLPRLENLEESQRITAGRLKTAMQSLMEHESLQMAEQAARAGDVRIITRAFTDREARDVLNHVKQLIRQEFRVVLFGIEGDNPALIFGRSGNVDLDLRPFLESACRSMEGKGGGSPSLAQGRGSKAVPVQPVLDAVRTAITNALAVK